MSRVSFSCLVLSLTVICVKSVIKKGEGEFFRSLELHERISQSEASKILLCSRINHARLAKHINSEKVDMLKQKLLDIMDKINFDTFCQI